MEQVLMTSSAFNVTVSSTTTYVEDVIMCAILIFPIIQL
jgi:hypothetical protein